MAEYSIAEITKNTKINKKFATEIETPTEINNIILGLELTEFYINTNTDAYCNGIEEIYMEFQGKEMRIFINKENKLQIYTD